VERRITSCSVAAQSNCQSARMVKMKNILLIALLILPVLSLAQTISFDKVKLLAEESEDNIGPDEMAMLVKKQGMLAGIAFSRCTNNSQSSSGNFTVVVELDSNGKVLNSWLNGTSSFAKCFHATIVEKFSFKPPSLPFYTAFEYTNVP